MRVPPEFLWGVATASYQIEGSVTADGRGESIWDRFSHTPGKVLNGDTGDVACDHYRRYARDVDMIAELGIPAYRFSVAWPRVFPQGSGRVNEPGLSFYERLVDALLARSIQPAVTLYHWDLPQALQDRGGWANRDTAGRFADYADTVYRALGDRVAFWITHNEPWCIAFLGHYKGEHAPGIRNLDTALATAHHVLLSHGLAVDAYRSTGLAAPIGITLSLWPTIPASDREEDADAARVADGYHNRWFLDPLFRARYPEDMIETFTALASPAAAVREGDLAQIARPIDFLGVNYYTRGRLRRDAAEPLGYSAVNPADLKLPITMMGGEIVPEGLHDLLLRLTDDYGKRPIYITENGAPFPDSPGADGEVRDPERVEFLRRHFHAALAARDEGVDLRGFFVWSLMDNFEWALGYDPRFGIVYVDYNTQRRIPKDSARFLQDVIRSGEIPDEPVALDPGGRRSQGG